MRFLILLCFALSALSAAETKLPADAAKAVERFDADAAKLRADAEKAVDVKAAVLVKELQRVQDATMKKGDLDAANAIKATIEKLAPKKEAAVAEVNPVGSYKVSKCNWEVNEIFLKDKGVALTSLGDKVMWSLVDGALVITWKDGSSSKGEYHGAGIANMVSDGKDHCNFTLTKE